VKKDPRQEGHVTGVHALAEREPENPVGVALDWKEWRQQIPIVEAQKSGHAKRSRGNSWLAHGAKHFPALQRRPIGVLRGDQPVA